MCRRTVLVGAAAAAVGIGLVLSCVMESVLLRILIGAALICAGFVVINRR